MRPIRVRTSGRFNIAPTQTVIVLRDTQRELVQMRWGLGARSIINARSETADAKPSFRNASRCLVPADGFYEWKTP